MGDLTPRQRELLVLLANGHTLGTAAERMGIRRQTAKNLASEAYRKLSVESRYAAFLELGWLTPPRR